MEVGFKNAFYCWIWHQPPYSGEKKPKPVFCTYNHLDRYKIDRNLYDLGILGLEEPEYKRLLHEIKFVLIPTLCMFKGSQLGAFCP